MSVAVINKSTPSKKINIATSCEEKSPSPIAHARSSMSGGRTVFYLHYGALSKSGNLSSYKFSFDETAYYFRWTRGSEDASHTLVLPVCRQTLELI